MGWHGVVMDDFEVRDERKQLRTYQHVVRPGAFTGICRQASMLTHIPAPNAKKQHLKSLSGVGSVVQSHYALARIIRVRVWLSAAMCVSYRQSASRV